MVGSFVKDLKIYYGEVGTDAEKHILDVLLSEPGGGWILMSQN